MLGLALAIHLLAGPASDGGYVVLLDRAADPAYRPAAERLAALHGAEVKTFDGGDLPSLRGVLGSTPPRYVAFVLPPARIDAQFAQQLLVTLSGLDEDPFLDVAYAFVTGRDGPHAERFVAQVEAARQRPFGRKAFLFGSWEGAAEPPAAALTALAAQGFDGREGYLLASLAPAARIERARALLADAASSDLLLFFSHGYPDRMEACYSGAEFRAWGVRFGPGLLVQCACFNGCPGRWWDNAPAGVVERPAPDPEQSVALALLDSGIAGYVAGVDMWHGPLAMQFTARLLDEGLSLGEASKASFDRLALDFQPEPPRYGPMAERGPRSEGNQNRRLNAAAMVVYGDPAWAPTAGRAAKRVTAQRSEVDRRNRITITAQPLVEGGIGNDFQLAQAFTTDYFSVRSNDWAKEASLEIVRQVDWPAGAADAPRFRVVEATCGPDRIPTGEPQAVVETTPGGRRLHLRVPFRVPMLQSPWPMGLAVRGFQVTLEETR